MKKLEIFSVEPITKIKNSMQIATLLLFGFGINCSIAIAQKLPKIQEVSQKAPANIRIDGKVDEWNGKFLAYNISNRIHYTISNDADYLYLTVQATDDPSTEKGLFGIRFTIKNPTAKSKKQNEVSITYPTQVRPFELEPIRDAVYFIKHFKSDTAKASIEKVNSSRLFVNERIPKVFKFIYFTGLAGIQDSSISIYNSKNIKAVALLDDDARYTYELALPLKELGSSITKEGKLKYNIKMEGMQRPLKNNGPPPPIVNYGNSAKAIDPLYLDFPTDFSGEYVLAK